VCAGQRQRCRHRHRQSWLAGVGAKRWARRRPPKRCPADVAPSSVWLCANHIGFLHGCRSPLRCGSTAANTGGCGTSRPGGLPVTAGLPRSVGTDSDGRARPGPAARSARSHPIRGWTDRAPRARRRFREDFAEPSGSGLPAEPNRKNLTGTLPTEIMQHLCATPGIDSPHHNAPPLRLAIDTGAARRDFALGLRSA